MPNGHLKLLRANITFEEAYQSPRGGGQRQRIPERYPAQHAQTLLAQLDAVAHQAEQLHHQTPRPPDATRELIALHPEAGYDLPEESLADKRRQEQTWQILMTERGLSFASLNSPRMTFDGSSSRVVEESEL